MKTWARLEGGTIADFAKDVENAGAVAVTAAVSAATDTLKEEFRADIPGAALGARLGSAIGSRVYTHSRASLGAVVGDEARIQYSPRVSSNSSGL
jgi:hypothetical protein